MPQNQKKHPHPDSSKVPQDKKKQKLVPNIDTEHITNTQGVEWVIERTKRTFIDERGLKLFGERDEQVRTMHAAIKALKWTKFAKNPGSRIPSLVREFYGNMDVEAETSEVRGTKISFAPHIINELYDTPQIDDMRFQALLDNPSLDFVQLAADLCPNGANWSFDSKGNRVYFLVKNLCTQAKLWLLFLSSRLEPNKNVSVVRMQRAAWIFALKNGYELNVGRVICESIKKCRTEKAAKSYFHGSTITKLILKYTKQTFPGFGKVFPTNIGRDTLRVLGPCIGPENEEEEEDEEEELQNPGNQLEAKIDFLLNETSALRTQVKFLLRCIPNPGPLGSIPSSILQDLVEPETPSFFTPHSFQKMDFNVKIAGQEVQEEVQQVQQPDFNENHQFFQSMEPYKTQNYLTPTQFITFGDPELGGDFTTGLGYFGQSTVASTSKSGKDFEDKSFDEFQNMLEMEQKKDTFSGTNAP